MAETGWETCVQHSIHPVTPFSTFPHQTPFFNVDLTRRPVPVIFARSPREAFKTGKMADDT